MHQKRMNVESQRDIEFLSDKTPATYFVFDILYIDGRNVEELQLSDRSKILSSVIAEAQKQYVLQNILKKRARHYSKVLLKGALRK